MKPDKIKQDQKIIKQLGGTSAVARMIQRSPQCVHNWTVRGIPAAVKLEHPELFLTGAKP